MALDVFNQTIELPEVFTIDTCANPAALPDTERITLEFHCYIRDGKLVFTAFRNFTRKPDLIANDTEEIRDLMAADIFSDSG